MEEIYGIYLSGSGGHPPKEVKLSGRTRKEVDDSRFRSCPVVRDYCSSVVTKSGVTLWRESGGWTDAGKKLFPK